MPLFGIGGQVRKDQAKRILATELSPSLEIARIIRHDKGMEPQLAEMIGSSSEWDYRHLSRKSLRTSFNLLPNFCQFSIAQSALGLSTHNS